MSVTVSHFTGQCDIYSKAWIASYWGKHFGAFLITKKETNLHVICILYLKSTGGFPAKRVFMLKVCPCHDRDCHFSADIFKCIFLNRNAWTSIKISLKFVPKGLINNILALLQIIAWRRPGAKPLSEPMIVSLLTLTCATRPQWAVLASRITTNNAPTKLKT